MNEKKEPNEITDDIGIDLSEFVSTPIASQTRKSRNRKKAIDKYDEAMKHASSLEIADVDSELTIPQMKAIELILQGKNAKEICEELNITHGDLRRWKNSEDFQSGIRDVRKEILYANRQNFTRLLPLAFKRLEDILKDEDIKAADTIRAIQVVFQGSTLIGNNHDDDNKSGTINNSQIIINPKFESKESEPKATIIDITPDSFKKEK